MESRKKKWSPRYGVKKKEMISLFFLMQINGVKKKNGVPKKKVLKKKVLKK